MSRYSRNTVSCLIVIACGGLPGKIIFWIAFVYVLAVPICMIIGSNDKLEDVNVKSDIFNVFAFVLGNTAGCLFFWMYSNEY